MRTLRARTRATDAARREGGFTLVFVALSLSALMVVTAIVIDIGYLRGSANIDQRTADLAVLSAGRKLGAANYPGACQDVITYLNTNAPDMPAINAVSFCSQTGNDVSKTTCVAGGTIAEAKPTITSGRYTVSVHFPVPDSEIADATFGAGNRDGTPCQRIRVLVTATEPSFFGRLVGSNGQTATRTATARALPGKIKKIPALWLLDPTGCVELGASGGAQLSVGTADVVGGDGKVLSPGVPGVMTLDSDGTACTGTTTTISSTGTGTLIKAISTAETAGSINLYAMAPGQTTCTGHACAPADVSAGNISPQPDPAGLRATRAPVDWRYNCKASYPMFHNIAIAGCPYTTPPYLDNLRNPALGGIPASGAIPGYQQWSASYSCNVPAGTLVVHGNWWVDCSGSQGMQISNGVSVTFADGNVVFDHGLSMTGGSLSINTANTLPTLASTCLPPVVTTPCINAASPKAGLVFNRAGGISVNSGTFNINKSFVYIAPDDGNGYVAIAGGATPNWSAPTEGPFAGLALWGEASSNKWNISGGGGVGLAGAFFTPEAADLSLGGGVNWGQQNAQFISYHIVVAGGSILTLSPDPNNAITLPPSGGTLIR